eukprot:scaffold867_cov317-Pavlova_lutheri.AAC.70
MADVGRGVVILRRSWKEGGCLESFPPPHTLPLPARGPIRIEETGGPRVRTNPRAGREKHTQGIFHLDRTLPFPLFHPVPTFRSTPSKGRDGPDRRDRRKGFPKAKGKGGSKRDPMGTRRPSYMREVTTTAASDDGWEGGADELRNP